MQKEKRMARLKEFLLLILFPLFYITIDLFFRKDYLLRYSQGQVGFYLVSILFTLMIFLCLNLILSKKYLSRGWKIFIGILSGFYYSFTVLASYLYVAFTSIFPNYYTFQYFKNEPQSAFSLLKDSIHWWEILIFLFLMSVFVTYVLAVAKTTLIEEIGKKIKARYLLIVIAILMAFQVRFIARYDQCLIVDANFCAAVGKHVLEGEDSKTFKGRGLPGRKPVKLGKINRNADYNILIVVFESLRRQNMGAYGYGRETTPFLSRLLHRENKRTFLFKNTYTVSTTTMLAIPAILGGITPDHPSDVYETFPLIWEYGKMLNYDTFFLSSHSMQWYRFDQYYSKSLPDIYWNKDNNQFPYFNDFGIDDRKTVDQLQSTLKKNRRKFLGVVQFNATHYPYKVPAEYERWKGRFIDQYDNSILYQDDLIKKVFEILKLKRLHKNTLVIMVGDHGEAFKEHNTVGHVDSYFTETLCVPMIFYIPEALQAKINLTSFKKNLVQNTANADLVPSLIHLLGLKKDSRVMAISGKLKGQNLFKALSRDRKIFTLNSNDLIRSNIGASLIQGNKHLIVRANRVPCSQEFYDIQADPWEKENLFSKENQVFIDQLKENLLKNSYSREFMELCSFFQK